MRAVAGPERVRDDLKPVMGAEDFAFVLRRVPGAYVFVGNGDTAGLHNPKYDFNDAALPHGVGLLGRTGQAGVALLIAAARRALISEGVCSIGFSGPFPSSSGLSRSP